MYPSGQTKNECKPKQALRKWEGYFASFRVSCLFKDAHWAMALKKKSRVDFRSTYETAERVNVDLHRLDAKPSFQ